MRRTTQTETGALGAVALVCYAATLAAVLGTTYAVVALALKALEFQQLVASARGGF